MNIQDSKIPELLQIGDSIAVLPVIHGSGQFALTVRRWMLEHEFDCIALPLPESFQSPVENAVLELPRPGIVIQPTAPDYSSELPWSPQKENDREQQQVCSYVPVDPCQPVIMAIRAALGEHIPRAYIDLETDPFLPYSTVMPDPYALRHVSPEKFAAALLPSITRPPDDQTRQRMVYMASRLFELQKRHDRILFVCSVLHWPWIREAYVDLFAGSGNDAGTAQLPEHDHVADPEYYGVNEQSLLFLLGELPFITSLYERARLELEDDENLQIDGVKELLIAARKSYLTEFGKRSRRITPLHLSKCLQYTRNLSLIHRRMTPSMISIVTATKQILGDQYALHVAERSSEYDMFGVSNAAIDLPEVKMGIDQARMPDGEVVSLVSRLPGPPLSWETLKLQKRPADPDRQRWQVAWNPYSQCSYEPEDDRIENFRTRVFDRAKAIIGNDLAKTEKFTTSVKDGIDIRDTLRHWYEKEIYVKVVPPSRGTLDACVMLFDSPSDPREYPWRTTWFAEHENESTLAFYATNFTDQMVGPGIGLGIYGGAMFLYPPVVIRDVWQDPQLDFTETLEERLIASACLHSRGRQIAILSALPPGRGWKKLAKHYRKQLVHVPLSSFSVEQVQQLRMVHVLNGKEVRSYAADFIRKV